MERFAFIPDPAQELLLRAGLWEGAGAVAAWEEWRPRRRIEEADAGSQRLAPLLYHNLHRLGWDGPEMVLLKGTFRKTWVHNERLAHMIEPLLHRWHRAGVPTMLLKGAALALRYYPHSGARPMDDLDVLVPEERARDALALFGDGDWTKPKGVALPKAFSADFTRRRRTVRYINRQDLSIELGWFLLAENRWPGIDAGVWRRAEAVCLRGAPARVPAAEHLLLHVLVHGAEWNEVPPIRWVPDAWMILRSREKDIDWGVFADEVLRRRVALPVRLALEYLAGPMGAPVPGAALEVLRAMRPSRAERDEFALVNRPKGERPRWRVFWFRHLRFHNLTASRCWWRRLARLPESLRLEWRLDRRWKAVVAGAAFALGSAAGKSAVAALRRKRRR